MAFIEGNFAKNSKPDYIDEIRKPKGHITENDAKLLLAKILRSNPKFAFNTLTGIEIYPFQWLKIKMMWERDYVCDVSSRGFAKTYTAAIFILLYAIFNQGIKILILGPSYKQSKLTLEYVLSFIKEPGAHFLRQFVDEKCLKKGSDRTTLHVGRSEIFCLPMGDGKKIRGARAQVIILDEVFAIPEHIIDEVVGPMMAVNAEVGERKKAKKWEDRMILEGLMEESERKKFKNNKLICLSSASYSFEPLYRRFKSYIHNIKDPEYLDSQDAKESDSTYGIINFGWEYAPDTLLQKDFVLSQKSKMSNDSFRREYEAQFSDDSASYFSMKSMVMATLEPAEGNQIIEISGDSPRDWVYILGIDPNHKNSEDSDHFAMCVIKAHRDSLHKGVVVHNYAITGVDSATTIEYLKYLLQKFNIEYMIIDAGGGHTFIESVNNSQIFKQANMALSPFDADFDKESNEGLSNAKKSYNLEGKKIVHVQNFSSAWIRRANEHLQMCFDRKKIFFAAKYIDHEFESLMSEDIPIEKLVFRLDRKDEFDGNSAKEKGYNKKLQFLDHQNMLLDLIKSESALVELRTTSQGHQSFDLPQNIRRQTGPDKTRKDSYSALLLANWGLKCYKDMNEVKIIKEDFMPWQPPIMTG